MAASQLSRLPEQVEDKWRGEPLQFDVHSCPIRSGRSPRFEPLEELWAPAYRVAVCERFAKQGLAADSGAFPIIGAADIASRGGLSYVDVCPWLRRITLTSCSGMRRRRPPSRSTNPRRGMRGIGFRAAPQPVWFLRRRPQLRGAHAFRGGPNSSGSAFREYFAVCQVSPLRQPVARWQIGQRGVVGCSSEPFHDAGPAGLSDFGLGRELLCSGTCACRIHEPASW